MENRLHLNKFLAVGIGSLPHTNPEEACSLVFKYFSDEIPFWPQLPFLSFKENMYVQYSEGLPGVVIDEKDKKIHIDTSRKDFANELEIAYQHYLDDDVEYFAISPEFAAGFYAFLKHLTPNTQHLYLKGHVIGPISFGLSVCDENKQAAIYNQEFRDCLVKTLSMKARWQVKKLRVTSHKSQVIIFIDEPYLVSVGSSYVALSPQEITGMINEVAAAIHKEGAFVGVHCCGNTDWSLVLKADIDILNFDAYDYLNSLLIYRKDLESFLDKGGVLAYGVVPTWKEEKLPQENALVKKIIYPHRRALITSACGLGTLSQKRAEEIIALVVKTAKRLQ